jgi:hypothetical protein
VRIVGRSLLDTDLTLPAVVEVILIGEALVCAEAEIRQADLCGLVGKADPAELGDAVVLAVDHKAMQMGVGPAEGDLDAMVQVGTGRGGMHQEPAPDERADRTEPKAKLKDGR